MFSGPTKVTLDAKGRLAIPTRYREEIAQRCDGQLYSTIDRDKCLLIYPRPAWEEVQRKLNRLPSFDSRNRWLQRMMVGYASPIDMDAQGRVLLPRELREFAGLERHAMLIGQGNRFELWDEERFTQERDAWLTQAANDDSLSADLDSFTL